MPGLRLLQPGHVLDSESDSAPTGGTRFSAFLRSRPHIRMTAYRWSVVLALLITAVNAWWALRDRTSPWWDQANYLHDTLIYRRALDAHGLTALISAIHHTDPQKAPLLTIAMLPLAYIFGPTMAAGLALNVLLWPALLLGTGAVAAELFGDRARIPSILMVAPMPFLVGASHTVMQEFLVVTLTVWVVLMALRTRLFDRRGASAGLGVLLGLGLLTKASFPTAVIGPLLVLLLASFWPCLRHLRQERQRLVRVTSNIGLTAILAGPLALIWYGPNWGPTMAFIRYTLAGGGELSGRVSAPLTSHQLAEFFVGLVNRISALAVLLCIVAVVLSLPQVPFRGGRRPSTESLIRGAVLATWFLGPVLAVATSHNQDPRYVLAAYPALALITGGLLANLQWRVVRRTLITVVGAIALMETLQANVPGFSLPLVPSKVTVYTRPYPLVIPLGGPNAFAPTPGGGGGTLDVLRYLESRSREASGQLRPAVVEILSVDEWLTVQNLSYYADTRGDPFIFLDPNPPNRDTLVSRLKSADFALYVPPGANGQVTVSHPPAAADFMTPGLFALFNPHPDRLAIGPWEGQARYVELLIRR